MEVIPYRESPFCLLHSFTAAEAGGGGMSFTSESRFGYPASRSFGYRKDPEKGAQRERVSYPRIILLLGGGGHWVRGGRSGDV